jgi:hypothetical protein
MAKRLREWHYEAIKLMLQGLSITDTAERLNKGRSTVSKFINDDPEFYAEVKQKVLGNDRFVPDTSIPSVQIATKNAELETKRIERVRLAWEAVDEALSSNEISITMKAKIAIEVLKGHGELTEKMQHEHQHLGVMLLASNQTPEQWEEETEAAEETEDVEADYSLVEE